MDFFDNLSQKIADAGETVYQKGKDFADTQKANMDIKEEERCIESLYARIGRDYVSAHQTEAEAEFGNFLSQIRTAQQHIDELKENIHDIKGLASCPHCGAEIHQDAAFCAHCGMKL